MLIGRVNLQTLDLDRRVFEVLAEEHGAGRAAPMPTRISRERKPLVERMPCRRPEALPNLSEG